MLANAKISPRADEIAGLLGGLLSRRVTAKTVKQLDITPPQTLFWGVYSDDQESNRIVCACDLNLAAYAGAALLLFPPSRAKESIAARELEEALEEDLREILNVLARLLNVPGGAHFKLGNVVKQKGKWPAELGSLPGPAPERIDLEVEIAGYGTGRMTILQL